jgi:hypothetical protein
MPLPLATTTGSILRLPSAQLDDDSANEDWSQATTPETGIRSHIYPVSGRTDMLVGQKEVVEYRLDADPCGLRNTDRWRDDPTGAVYLVVWAKSRVGLGLDHLEAGLRTVSGESP